MRAELKAAGLPTWSWSRALRGRHLARRTATRCPTRRTPSTLVAEQVPGIDAILVGHAHVEIPQRFVTNKAPASRCC